MGSPHLRLTPAPTPTGPDTRFKLISMIAETSPRGETYNGGY
jgi:hypothetical protein